MFWGCRDEVLTHVAFLRTALQALGGPLRRVFVLCRASVCGSGLKGRFPVAQDAALGQGQPQKIVFRPEGPISRRVLFSCSCTGFPGGSAETGPSGLVRVFGGCRACACGSGPKSCFPVVQGAALAMPAFAAVMAHRSMPHPAPKLANGQGTTLPRASPDGLGSEVPNLFLKSQPMHSTITIGG